ncbi:hypothetical protein Syun_023836 [Stephania yunnanensis]|uniref:Uncharacterized protein n=1 Tax=Stephania yunnanensis TaxID=152371 RepID=A0AAP0FDD3_9MAGN
MAETTAISGDTGQVRRKQCCGSEERDSSSGGSVAEAADGGSNEIGVRPCEQSWHRGRPTAEADWEVARLWGRQRAAAWRTPMREGGLSSGNGNSSGGGAVNDVSNDARWRVAGPIDPRRDTTTVDKES